MTATPILLSDNSSGVGEAAAADAAADAVDAAASPSFQFYAQVRIFRQKTLTLYLRRSKQKTFLSCEKISADA